MTEREIFIAALHESDPGQRAAFLDRACGGDQAMRMRLEELLSEQEQLGSFLEQPAEDPEETDISPLLLGPDAAAASSEKPGVMIGPYKLLEQIGEGGMGTVRMAEQTEPIRRRVAVKLIKAGMDSRQVLVRFEAERQALALMDHPNIAKVLDGGLHEQRPFFVMELVKGVPITDFCDTRKLTPKERLELFVPVCQAIQHAHHKGIIHRDIKPSNVLIALYDDRPVVKVIDFGVAKATGGTLTEHTIETGFGGVVGTPQYMSPEQATFNNLDIDTRSDVYALGVLLYELLTGSPPFARKELQKAGLLEILRVVREDEPPRPSAKLSTADALPTLSANRSTEPRKLTGLLRKELDWIIMKALEKNRARRYETANGFAADVLRYLGGEAVLAHPPSTAYRLKKFVKRYKGQVLAASLVFLALLAGIVGTTLGLLEAKKQEAEAKRQEGLALLATEEEKAAKLEAQKNLQQANENLAFAKKSNEILDSVFAGLNPNNNYGTLGELSQALKDNLKKAVQELEGSAIGDPLTVAGMQNTLGLSLLGLGEPSQAIVLFEKARATVAAKFGADHPDTLTFMCNVALGYEAAGKPERTLPLLEEALKHAKAKLGPDHPSTLTIMANLATGYQGTGKLDRALPLLKEAFELQRAKLGPDHPLTLISMGNLAAGYWSAGQLNKSIPLFEESLKLQEKKLGRQHPNTQMTVANLGVNYTDAGRVQEALPLLEEAFQAAKSNAAFRWVGPELLESYCKAGKTAEAAKLVQELLADARKQIPKNSPQLAGELALFGLSLLQTHAFPDAEALLREGLTIREKTQPDVWNTFNTMSMLGAALLGQKKYAEAEPLLLKGYEGMKKREKTIPKRGGAELRIPEALDRLIELYTATNKPEEAAKWRIERAKYPEPKKPVAPEKK